MARNQYHAYSIATRTVPKTRQVVLLYDGTIRFLRQAKDAIAERRIEDRFNLLLRASQIIAGLRNSIDFDKGGDVAHTLERFYTGVDMRILNINFNKENPADSCDMVIADLKQMRDAWNEIDRSLAETPPDDASEPSPAAPSGTNGSFSLSA